MLERTLISSVFHVEKLMELNSRSVPNVVRITLIPRSVTLHSAMVGA